MLTESSRSSARMKLLDQALAGQSAEVKARVQNILLRYDIDVENEFFLIFTAIGHLLAIVEESPENWQALFDDVHLDLERWSKENFRSLENIKLHAKTSAELIAVLRQLLSSMQNSQLYSQATSKGLSGLRLSLNSTSADLSKLSLSSDLCERKLSDLSMEISRSRGQLNGLVNGSNEMQNFLSAILSGVNELSEGQHRNGIREWVLNCSVCVLMVFSMALMMSHRTMSAQIGQQQGLLRAQRKEMGWLLNKANRAECLEGIKPPDDPQCVQYGL